jgi:acyl carrier protein
MDTSSLSDILKSVQTLLVEEYGCDPRDVTPEASFRGTLKLDSLEVTEIILSLEDSCSAGIPDDEAQKLLTVKDAVAYIENSRSRAN